MNKTVRNKLSKERNISGHKRSTANRLTEINILQGKPILVFEIGCSLLYFFKFYLSILTIFTIISFALYFQKKQSTNKSYSKIKVIKKTKTNKSIKIKNKSN